MTVTRFHTRTATLLLALALTLSIATGCGSDKSSDSGGSDSSGSSVGSGGGSADPSGSPDAGDSADAGDSGGSRDSANSSGSADPGSSADSGSEEDRIKEVFAQWQEDFTTGKGEETCARLTESGRKELLAYRDIAGNIDPDADCPEVVSSIIAATEKAGVKQQPAKVVSAKISGNKAIAQVSDAGRPPVPVRLVKVDGEWMLPSAGFGALIDQQGGG